MNIFGIAYILPGRGKYTWRERSRSSGVANRKTPFGSRTTTVLCCGIQQLLLLLLLLPFYGPLSGWARTRRDIHPLTPEIIDFGGSWSVIILDLESNLGKCTNNPAGCYPIRTIDATTSIIPPVLCRMPLLPQPSQFILAWDKQICWTAYLEAWLQQLIAININ